MATQRRKSATDITNQVGRILDLAYRGNNNDTKRAETALKIQRKYLSNMAKLDKGESGRRDMNRKYTRNQRIGIGTAK